MDTPEGLKTPGRVVSMIPVLVAAVLVLAVVIFAAAHFAAKGPGNAAEVTSEQIDAGATPPARGPYNSADFTEPTAK